MLLRLGLLRDQRELRLLVGGERLLGLNRRGELLLQLAHRRRRLLLGRLRHLLRLGGLGGLLLRGGDLRLHPLHVLLAVALKVLDLGLELLVQLLGRRKGLRRGLVARLRLRQLRLQPLDRGDELADGRVAHGLGVDVELLLLHLELALQAAGLLARLVQRLELLPTSPSAPSTAESLRRSAPSSVRRASIEWVALAREPPVSVPEGS